jgi:hypothetical protein
VQQLSVIIIIHDFVGINLVDILPVVLVIQRQV